MKKFSRILIVLFFSFSFLYRSLAFSLEQDELKGFLKGLVSPEERSMAISAVEEILPQLKVLQPFLSPSGEIYLTPLVWGQNNHFAGVITIDSQNGKLWPGEKFDSYSFTPPVISPEEALKIAKQVLPLINTADVYPSFSQGIFFVELIHNGKIVGMVSTDGKDVF